MGVRSIWGHSKSSAPIKIDLRDIQDEMRGLLVGCVGEHVQRLIFKVTAAQKVSELWMLRSDMYQTIALQTQFVVAETNFFITT